MENTSIKKTVRSNFDNLMFIFKHIWQWDKSVLVIIFFQSIFTAIAPFIWVFTPKFVIDELLELKRPEVLIGILATALTLASVTNYFTAYFTGAFRMKVSFIRFKFIDLINEKAMTMDFKHTEDPEVLNAIQQSWRTCSSPLRGLGGVLQKVFSIIGSIIGFFGYITILLVLNPLLLLYLVGNILISYYLTLKVKNYERSKKDEISQYERKSRYVGVTMSDFQFGKDIRIYNLKPLLMEKREYFDNKLLDIFKDIQGKYFKTSALESFLLLIREAIVYAYLVFRVVVQGMSIGNFTMYAASIGGFAGWMDNLMKDIATIKVNLLYINDLRDFLAIEDEEAPEHITEIPQEKPYEIEFKNVSFKYPNSERYILQNLCLKIKAGEKLAIVGINGAGKTTFVKLLTRLYKPTEGEILLNGVNINEFDQLEYYRLFSVVFQDIRMFAFSLLENITFTEGETDMEKALSSIEKAGIKGKIDSLPKGLNTSILKILDGEGIEFSGGESQKLALARALYKNGEIVILDEPTAALDPLAEYELYNGFNNMIGNRTAIFISHRLSSTRFCDHVAFFENGKIKEYGSHEDLIELDESYANMFNIQAQYYREDQLKKGA